VDLVDTTPESARAYVEAYSSLSGSERVERSMAMAEEVKAITLAGIRHRNPHATDDEVHHEWLRILHGDELAKTLRESI